MNCENCILVCKTTYGICPNFKPKPEEQMTDKRDCNNCAHDETSRDDIPCKYCPRQYVDKWEPIRRNPVEEAEEMINFNLTHNREYILIEDQKKILTAIQYLKERQK